MLVLIAEDDAVSRRILQRSVERLGHRCLVAEDGEGAWALYRDHRPDVIISDWVMPGLDGLSLCRRMRSNPLSGYPYFILLTSRTEKQHRLEGMQAGADDYLTKPLDRDDLQLRLIAARRTTALHRKLIEQAAELERLSERLYQDGRRDALTGIGNRRAMQDDLSKMMARATRYEQRFAIALIDIDHFKRYNDTCGHLAGDETLRAVAQTLSGEMRAGDAVYRYGGEEFLAVFTGQDATGALEAAERMRICIQGLGIPHPGKTPTGPVTVSAGIAQSHGIDASLSELMRRADAALYGAKQRGRNQVCTWQSLPGAQSEPSLVA